MQKKILTEKLLEQASSLQKLLSSLHGNHHHDEKEIDGLLGETENMVRLLSAYKYLITNTESKDLDVHVKIMQNISKQEEIKIVTENIIKHPEPTTEEKTADPAQKETPITVPVQEVIETMSDKKEEKPLESTVIARKKIELGINDKYRIINELFGQSNVEFNAALEQLNISETLEDANDYLDNLKNLYRWKQEHPLVKLLYNLVQKRFQ